MGILREAGGMFGVLMTFFLLSLFAVFTLMFGYDKGWSGPIDSFGMSLDVLGATIILLFMVIGLFAVIMRRRY